MGRLLQGVAVLVLVFSACPAWGAQVDEEPKPVPVDDYPIYDRVIIDKLLTSKTTLVVIQRLTATQVAPFADGPPDLDFFEVNQFFGTGLDPDLVMDFVHKAGSPFRLQSRFNFGVPYQFASGDALEGPEVSLAPIPAQAAPPPREGPPPTVGVLELSRVAFNRPENQALVYVGVDRPDGTGAGFLFLLYRMGTLWRSADSEVLWTKSP